MILSAIYYFNNKLVIVCFASRDYFLYCFSRIIEGMPLIIHRNVI